MGSTVSLTNKCGITINGIDALDLHPEDVKAVINSDDTGIVRAIFENSLMDDDKFPIPNDYAKDYGRPSLDKVPFMHSENDGYPYLKGHDPLCDGKPYARTNGKRKVCKCKYDTWNHARGSSMQVWPGGPDLDDFDM